MVSYSSEFRVTSGKVVAIDPELANYAQNPLRPDLHPCLEDEAYCSMSGRDKLLAFEAIATGDLPDRNQLGCVGYFELEAGTYRVSAANIKRLPPFSSIPRDATFSVSSNAIIFLDADMLDRFLAVFDINKLFDAEGNVDRDVLYANSMQIARDAHAYAVVPISTEPGVEFNAAGEYYLSSENLGKAETRMGGEDMQKKRRHSTTSMFDQGGVRISKHKHKNHELPPLEEQEPQVLFTDEKPKDPAAKKKGKSPLRVSHREPSKPAIAEHATPQVMSEDDEWTSGVFDSIKSLFSKDKEDIGKFRVYQCPEMSFAFKVPEEWFEYEAEDMLVFAPEGQQLPRLEFGIGVKPSNDITLNDIFLDYTSELKHPAQNTQGKKVHKHQAIRYRTLESGDGHPVMVENILIDLKQSFAVLRLVGGVTQSKEVHRIFEFIEDSISL